jgi:hypothetical protein
VGVWVRCGFAYRRSITCIRPRSVPPPPPPAPAALLSRQFVDISRIRIEGLLAAFPKLIGGDGGPAGASSSSSAKQHTFVETDNVRCVEGTADAQCMP